MRDVLGRWGKKVGEATRKAEDLAGNTWQHCEFDLVFLIISLALCVFGACLYLLGAQLISIMIPTRLLMSCRIVPIK